MLDYAFSQLIDLEQVRQLLESHHRLSGMAYGLFDTSENNLIAVGWQEICVRFHRVHPVTAARCRESDAFIKAHLHDSTGQMLEYRCKNNMIDIAMPIMIEGKHQATFFTGQFFYGDDPPDRDFFVAQAKALGFDTAEYLAALDKVPLFSREHIRGNVLFLHNMVRNFAELGLRNLRLAREAEERRQAEEEIRHYKDRLEVLVDERTSELKAAMAKLEQSNHDLDEFAYIASHDLKEPLRGIHNYVSFLKEDYAAKLDDEGRTYLDRMQRLAERLAELIDRLLSYSRLSSRPLPMETVDMEAVLDNVAADLEPSLTSAGVELRRAGRLPTVTGNAMRLGEVFQNLIGNAIKYNDKAQKWVEAGCDASGPVPVFYVRDNGIGIPEQHHETIFRIFKRLHEQSKYGGGTGAGLTIVKKIVERHGGRIWLESTPGEGTTFYFTLGADA